MVLRLSLAENLMTHSLNVSIPSRSLARRKTPEGDYHGVIKDVTRRDDPGRRPQMSLKLFLGSFRNHGGFHEETTVAIAKRLVAEIAPRWLRIGGYWYPRGGMPIDVFWQTGAPPEGLWLPDQGVAPYRGRG